MRRHTGDNDQTIEAARTRVLTIHSAARQTRQGSYFFSLVPASIDDPELDMRSTVKAIFDSGMNPVQRGIRGSRVRISRAIRSIRT